jgi:hypothetical protein
MNYPAPDRHYPAIIRRAESSKSAILPISGKNYPAFIRRPSPRGGPLPPDNHPKGWDYPAGQPRRSRTVSEGNYPAFIRRFQIRRLTGPRK